MSALDQSTVRRSAEEREGEARRERERLGEEERKRKREGKAGEMENVTVSQARHPASISKISHLETAFVLIGIALGRLEAQCEAGRQTCISPQHAKQLTSRTCYFVAGRPIHHHPLLALPCSHNAGVNTLVSTGPKYIHTCTSKCSVSAYGMKYGLSDTTLKG